MHLASMSLRDRWVYALKVASWPKLLIPAVLGQAIGIAVNGKISVAGLLAGMGFTLVLLAYVVLLNDWGDQDVDALKRRLFPEACSPKTIPDDILEARSVLWAGLGAGSTAVGIGVATQLWLGRPGLAIASLMCLGLFWAYTLPPFRLNYRGGGEVLEMLGVGFLLPWWNAYAQGGEPMPAGIVILPAFALLAMSSALASGLSDEPSDRLGGKRTFTTMFGALAVRQAVEGLVLGAMIVWAILPLLAPAFAHALLMLPALIAMANEYRILRKVGLAADVDTYHGTTLFKHHMHLCMWRGTGVLAVTLMAYALVFGAVTLW